MNILVSSAGRRGALVRLLQKEVADLGGRVYATDSDTWSAACRLADGWDRVPRCTNPDFVERTLDICRQREIRLIVPTIDTELPIYAAHKQLFRDAGVEVAISGPETVSIGGDKIRTHSFLLENQLPVVRQHVVDVACPETIPELPVIIKPRRGSASIGVQRIEDAEAFWFHFKRCAEPIVQEVARGHEYTVNFYVDRQGRCISAVPHRRFETRGGEVSKAIAEKHPLLIETARRLTKALPDAWGALCFQAFVDDSGGIRMIEINPRFGGGYPIAHATGANFIRMLVNEVRGLSIPEPNDNWTNGVAMIRWEDAVFTTAEDVAR